jgi:peroxiredoxin
MVSPNQPNLNEVDWSRIPAPEDDDGARHLTGMAVPDVALAATDGTQVSLAKVPGRVVVFAYPRTGVPGQVSPVPDWDMIPGARGCTPQACAYRDLHKELTAAGAARVLGLSTQDTAYQREAAERLHLPFPLLSDEKLALARAMRLPVMEVGGQVGGQEGGMTLIKRLAMIIDDGRIAQVFYPVFPPDRNAGDVLAWLQQNRRP